MADGETTLIMLGTSSGVPTATRGNAAQVLRHRGKTYLIDCGEPLTQALLRAGVDPLSLTAIFLTHLHIDHLGGLPQLVQTLQIRGRSQPLPVYLPAEGLAPLAHFLEAVYLSPDLLPFPLRLLGAGLGEIYHDGVVRVTTHRNAHLDGLRARAGDVSVKHPGWALESRSLVVEAGEERIVFSGDLRGPDELAPLVAEATTLVCELVHFLPATLYPVLASATRLRDLVLTHFHPNVEHRAVEIIGEARRRLPEGTRVHWAEDGLAVGLGGPVASQPPLLMV
ncbi:MAG: MBL fold metallo-hydrolase [Chloroflexi bacterium]|nr:MBL fold metallo-hydrolase [Chloroflexota bacterium]